MKMCLNCEKLVNITRNEVNIGIADIWNDHCEECGYFIDSGVRNVTDLAFDMRDGIDKCKVSINKKG